MDVILSRPPWCNPADMARNLDQSALVTYVTAGFPRPEDTPDICLAMEKGGAGRPYHIPHLPPRHQPRPVTDI